MQSFDFESFRVSDDADVTAAVISGEPSEPEALEDVMPEFLRRNPDGSWKHPWTASSIPLTTATATIADASAGGENGPENGTTPELSTEDLRKRANENRKRVSIAKLRNRMAAAKATQEGHVWRNGKFMPHDAMSKGEYERIKRQMNTPACLRIFVHDYSAKVIR